MREEGAGAADFISWGQREGGAESERDSLCTAPSTRAHRLSARGGTQAHPPTRLPHPRIQLFQGTALSRTLIAMGLWAALAATLPLAQASAQDGRGEKLFGLCTQCHGSAAGGNPAALAPAIAGLDAWYIEAQLAKFRSGVRGMHPQDTGGLRMYPMSLWLASDADAAAVAAYVSQLPVVRPAPQLSGGDAQRGQQLFAPCVACHGPNAAGNEAMKAPPLAGGSDWYLLSSLQKFKAGIRGADPADQTGAIMRAMSSTLPDEQAMRDVIAYIMTLSR